MRENKKIIKYPINKILRYFIWSGVTITIYFNTQMADPFNAPKMYALIFFSMIWLPQIFSKNLYRIKNNATSLNLTIFFILALIWAYLNSPSKLVAFFGESQRQLGLVTYIGLAIFFLLFALYTNFSFRTSFQTAILFLSLINIIYGLMQYTGNDFVKWVNQYNPIIGTLGNPNFASALMAILLVLCFTMALIPENKFHLRALAIFLSFGLLLVIYLSEALQGLLSLGAGISILLFIIIYFKNKLLGYVFGISSLVVLVFSVAGIFQSGPLTSVLYKESVSLRGYYWRAGINMFKDNLLTGIGLDYYGAYFKSYRESRFPLKHGYDLLSTNAHNVPIQIFATGGIFLGLTYLLLLLWVFYCSLKAIKIAKASERVFLVGIFAAWVTYLSQSIVSIDNIGLTVWGWILSGILVGLHRELINRTENSGPTLNTNVSNRNTRIALPLYSILFGMVGFIFILTISKTEFEVIKMRNEMSAASELSIQNANILADKISKDRFAQPIYKIQVADLYVRQGKIENAIKLSREITSSMPMYPTYEWTLANLLESNGRFNDSILIRKQLIKSDPQNINNYLQLLRLYIEIKDSYSAKVMVDKIKKFSPNSEQASIAESEYRKAFMENAR